MGKSVSISLYFLYGVGQKLSVSMYCTLTTRINWRVNNFWWAWDSEVNLYMGQGMSEIYFFIRRGQRRSPVSKDTHTRTYRKVYVELKPNIQPKYTKRSTVTGLVGMALLSLFLNLSTSVIATTYSTIQRLDMWTGANQYNTVHWFSVPSFLPDTVLSFTGGLGEWRWMMWSDDHDGYSLHDLWWRNKSLIYSIRKVMG